MNRTAVDHERKRKGFLWVTTLAVGILAVGCALQQEYADNAKFEAQMTVQAVVSATDQARSPEMFEKEMGELPLGVKEAAVMFDQGSGVIVERRAIPGDLENEILIVYTAGHVVVSESGNVTKSAVMKPIASTVEEEEKSKTEMIIEEMSPWDGGFDWRGNIRVATDGGEFAVVAMKVPKNPNNNREIGRDRVLTLADLQEGQSLKSVGFPKAAQAHGKIFPVDLEVSNPEEIWVGGWRGVRVRAIRISGVGSEGASGEGVYDLEGKLVGINFAYIVDGNISLYMARIPENIDELTNKAVAEVMK